MKVITTDADGQSYEVGYEMIYDSELDHDVPMFWVETQHETVTMVMTKANMQQLVSAINLLIQG